jgi:hypothetical protein
MTNFPEVIVHRLPVGLSDALNRAAETRGIARSQFIRSALIEAVRVAGVHWPPRSNALHRLAGFEQADAELDDRVAQIESELAKGAADAGAA